MNEVLLELVKRFNGIPIEIKQWASSFGGSLVTVLMLRPKTLYDFCSLLAIGLIVSVFGYTKAMKMFDMDEMAGRLFTGIAGVSIAKLIKRFIDKKQPDNDSNPSNDAPE